MTLSWMNFAVPFPYGSTYGRMVHMSLTPVPTPLQTIICYLDLFSRWYMGREAAVNGGSRNLARGGGRVVELRWVGSVEGQNCSFSLEIGHYGEFS